MLLEAVERHVGIEQRIVIVEADDEPQRDTTLRHRVDEAAAELILQERIPQRVDHGARFDAALGNLPQLLEADGVLLGLPVLRQIEPPHDVLRQVAAHAVTEDRDLGQDLHARLELALLRSVLCDAAIACPDADHTCAIEQHLASGKPAEHIDAFRLDLRRQPPHQLVQRDDVVAVILEWGRDDRKRELRLLRQVVDVIAVNGNGEGYAFGLAVRNQLAEGRGVEDGARQRVRSGFTRLLEHGDRERIAAARLLELRETKSGRQAGGATADDQHVDFESLAHSVGSLLYTVGRSPDDGPTDQ